MARCKARTKSGERCQSYAIEGSDYCVAHAPELAEHRREWRRKGGRRGRNKDAIQEARWLHTAEEVAEFVPTIIRELEAGNIDANTANSIRGFCKLQLQALKLTALEKRIAAVEQMLR